MSTAYAPAEWLQTPFGHPRRMDITAMQPLELALYELTVRIDREGGAGVRLTDCVALLFDAHMALADHIEEQMTKQPGVLT